MKVSERFQSAPQKDGTTGSASEHSDVYERWLAFLSRHLFTYAMSSSKQQGFEINARSRSASGFTMARFTTVKGASNLYRGPAEINADNRDGYIIYLPIRGQIQLTQFNRSQLYDPHSSVLLSSSERIVHTKLGDNDTLCFLMPRSFVEQRAVRGEELCARPPEAPSTGIRRWFADTLLAFERDAPTMTEAEFIAAARMIGELSLLAISGSLDVTSSLHSVRASSLARAKRIIRNRLSDPELSPAAVARDCGISLRYLHALFRQDGRTVREYLTEERLREARHLLETDLVYVSKVTDVSLACGFSSPSQFSTAFRRAFGLSPRDVMRGRY